MHEGIKTKFEELKEEDDDAWEYLKSGTELAKGTLVDTLLSAASRFKWPSCCRGGHVTLQPASNGLFRNDISDMRI